MNINLSIIIVSYNNFSMLRNCLSSVCKYISNINYEVIVVDNNSTEEGLIEAINEFKSVILIRNAENRGFAKANNQGVEIAKGENILLLNNDTELLDNSILEIVKYIQGAKKSTIGAAQLLNVDLTHQPSAYKFPSIWRMISSNLFLEAVFNKTEVFNKYYLKIENRKHELKVDSVIGAFMLMKKETFKNLGGFDENFFFYHEDTDLCFRLAKNGGETIYFPQYSLIHIGGGTANNLKWFQLKNKVIARFKYFNKHYSVSYYLIVQIIEYGGNLMRSIIYLILGLLTFSKEKLNLAYFHIKTLTLSIKVNND